MRQGFKAAIDSGINLNLTFDLRHGGFSAKKKVLGVVTFRNRVFKD